MIYVFTLTCRRSIFWLGRANLSNLLYWTICPQLFAESIGRRSDYLIHLAHIIGMDFCDVLSFRVLVDLHFDSCLLQFRRVIVRELAINVFGIVLLQRLVVKLCVGFLSCGDTNRRVITVLCLIARHGKTEHVVLAFNDFCIVDYHIANNDIEPCKAVAVFRRIFHRILRRDFLRRCNLKLLLENAAFICGQKRLTNGAF